MTSLTADPAARRDIPDATVARLPVYLRALTALAERGISTVSSEELAAAAGVNSAKLRKDLSHLGSYGIRGVGYDVDYLVYQISRELGLTQDWPVVIVGIGNLGHALANYGGFATRGFRGRRAVRRRPRASSARRSPGLTVQLDRRPRAGRPPSAASRSASIATPAAAAQEVCDRLVAAGVHSVLNFAPCVLTVPDDVDVRKVDLSTELQILAFHEQRKALAERTAGASLPAAAVAALQEVPHEPVVVRRPVPPHRPARPCWSASRSTPTGPPRWPARSAAASTSARRSCSPPATGSRSTPTSQRSTAAVTELGDALAAATGVPLDELSEHLYVHYEDRAVAHLFSVACGLDSMAVGEGQILGQVRDALRAAQDAGDAGRRARARCSSRRCGSASARTPRPASTAPARPWSSAGLEHAARTLGPLERHPGPRRRCRLDERAGRHHGAAAGARDLVIVNRTLEQAERLAAATVGRALPFEALAEALAEADLVVSCTGAVGHVVGAAAVAAAAAVRRAAGRRSTSTSRLPRDVDPAVGALPGVDVIDLEALGEALAAAGESDAAPDGGARTSWPRRSRPTSTGRRAQAVAPTVVALRARAAEVVAAELARLEQRLPSLDEPTRAEVQQTVHRVVEKLLHAPTVRVKELAGEGRRRRLRRRRCASCSTSTRTTSPRCPCPRRRDRWREHPHRRQPHGCHGCTDRAGCVDRRDPARHPAQRARARPVRAGSPTRCRGDRPPGRAGRDHHLRRHLDRAAGHHRRHRRLRHRAARTRCWRGEVDLAVHSLKDLPTAPEPGLVIAAVPAREDPRDVLVARDGLTLGELPAGSRRRHRLAAPRRAAARARPRPATSSRSAATSTPGCGWSHDGRSTRVVLARAGLLRLGRARRGDRGPRPAADAARPRPGRARRRVPRRRRRRWSPPLAALDDADTRAAVTAERALLAALEAGCTAPVGALAEVVDSGDGVVELSLRAVAAASTAPIDLRRSHRRPGRAGRAARPRAGRGAARRRRQRDLDQHRPACTCRPATRPRRGERGRPPPRRPDCRTALSVPPRPTHTGACLVSPTRSTTPADPTASSTTPATSMTSTTSRVRTPGPRAVAFVGAGPGDPGLLTLRAVELLAAADVVVIDQLRREEVLAGLARPDVEVVDAGFGERRPAAHPGHPGQARGQGGQVGRRQGATGRPVVRLMDGDPADLQRPGRGGAGLPQGRRAVRGRARRLGRLGRAGLRRRAADPRRVAALHVVTRRDTKVDWSRSTADDVTVVVLGTPESLARRWATCSPPVGRPRRRSPSPSTARRSSSARSPAPWARSRR